MGCEDDSRSESRCEYVKPYPPNPLDFVFFERPMHSEDEAKFMIDWQKRRRLTTTMSASNAPVMAEGEVDVDDEITLLKEEEESQQGRNEAFDEATAVPCKETQRRLLISILIQVYRSQVKSKALKETYELSLKLLAFASDSLLGLATTKDAKGTATVADSPAQDCATLTLKVELCRLLLTAVTGTQLHSDYVVALQGNKVLELAMLTLEDLVASATDEREEKEGEMLKCATELASCILHLVDSFYSYSWRWLPRTGMPKRLAENWSRNTSGFLTMEKLLVVYMKWSLKNRRAAKTSSLFFSKLCSSIASFCEATDAEIAIQPQTVSRLVSDQPHCRLYSTMAKYLPEAVRAGGLTSTVHDILDALMASSPAWNSVPLTFIWDSAIYAVRCSQGDLFDRKLVEKLFNFAEAVLERDYILEKSEASPSGGPGLNLSSERIHKRLFHHCQETAAISDSDSAFCASDASLDRFTVTRTERSPPLGTVAKSSAKYSSRSFPQAKHYMEILRSDCPVLVAAVVAHLKKILLPSCQAFRYQIFSKVIVPFLQEQTLTPSAAADVDNVAVASEDCVNRLEAIKKLLGIIPELLGNKDSLNYFHQHKVLNTVLAFKEISGAVEVTYNVFRAYLIAEIESVIYSKLFQKLTTVEIDVDSSSDDLEPTLTDEEAFQPKFIKALTLTSIVKVFHQILVSKTAKVLDLKAGSNGEAALSKLSDLDWEELVHVWKTQAVLVQRYSEYQDYAGSKGISRIVEDLFSYLSAQMAFADLNEKMVGNFLLPTLGFLLQVMVQFKENGELSQREKDTAGKKTTQPLIDVSV